MKGEKMNTGEIQMVTKSGRRPNLRQRAFMQKYGIHPENVKRVLRKVDMDQLDRCADDCARRILLGKSK